MTGLHSFPEGTFLHYLPHPVRERLLALGTEARFGAGRVLMRQGEASKPIFVLLEGLAKVSAPDGGHESLLAVRVAGDVVGDMVPLTHSLHAATVTACGAVRASVVSGPAFLDFVRGCAPAGLAMSRFIVDRLRWAEQSRLDLAGYDTPACLARLLLSLAGRHGRPGPGGLDVGVPLTRAELASLAGTDPEITGKALRDLRRRRLVRRCAGGLEILDVAGLEALADLRAF
ncbi:Crp/Fnr family transcriptional regulator [Nonomuraea sp. SBT364]|uniref:Crp/Fnr family transcriptional regulator n=1 Tax=Nonomuraea sp. SBT364 TaxID=1580530 RepID=UPI000B29336A|nr:Crp/Fnr family transcriptional regulator [Nonomuraea sp. SBT364]